MNFKTVPIWRDEPGHGGAAESSKTHVGVRCGASRRADGPRRARSRRCVRHTGGPVPDARKRSSVCVGGCRRGRVVPKLSRIAHRETRQVHLPSRTFLEHRMRDDLLASRRMPLHRIVAAVLFSLAGGTCHTGDCSNGECACPTGASCDFECASPPCHVDCEGNNSQCTGICGNGECTCGQGSQCDFECHSPPCHVTCERDTVCTGTCGNGDCTCGQGSECAFTCTSGPCHVACEGGNRSCSGECANGTCTCGSNSECSFVCIDGDCAIDCAANSSCVLTCQVGEPGAQGCRFSACGAGEPVLCPDGNTLVCGAECPSRG